jgi:hypothetical protein
MEPYEIYITYLSLCNHFKHGGDKYNFIRFNGKVKASRSSFEKRNDYKMFRVAKFKDVRDFLATFLCFVSLNRGSIPSISDVLMLKQNEPLKIRKWHSKIESITTNMIIDLNKLRIYTLKDILLPSNGYPKLLESWLHGHISAETVLCVITSSKIDVVWDTIYTNNIYKELYTQHIRTLRAYSYFVNLDTDKITEKWLEWKDYIDIHS